MRRLVVTPKFKRAFRKFVKRNTDLQQRIEVTKIDIMGWIEENVNDIARIAKTSITTTN